MDKLEIEQFAWFPTKMDDDGSVVWLEPYIATYSATCNVWNFEKYHWRHKSNRKLTDTTTS